MLVNILKSDTSDNGIFPVRIFSLLLLSLVVILLSCNSKKERFLLLEKEGAIIRMDTSRRQMYLVFTGHDFAQGCKVIDKVLTKHQIKASFFFTGDFYRTQEFSDCIHGLLKNGHYLGAHSDQHLLYCDWGKRDSLLVTREEFTKDLEDNYQEMKKFGIKKEDALFFMPPYEWYNKDIAGWTAAIGLKLINFTPGTSSNQDWTYPELGKTYITSDDIFNRIIDYEEKSGMNGFILLTHIGTDPRRPDPFYIYLDSLISELKILGYSFGRLGE